MKKIIKGKVPSLISGSNGKPKRITTKRKSECRRCREAIQGGEYCFEIPSASSGFRSPKRYCLGCFKDILAQSKRDLADLKSSLDEVDLDLLTDGY